MDDYVRLLDVIDITKRAGVYSIVAKELFNLEGFNIQLLEDKVKTLEKIKVIVDEWQSDTWTDNLSYECMSKIAAVLVEGEE